MNDDKQYPHADYGYVGGDYRRRAIERPNGELWTGEVALAAVEKEQDRKLTLSERREFYDGWRRGLANYYAGRALRLMNYLRAEQVEALGADMEALVRKYEAKLK